jgi:predicted Zn-dependent protease
MFGRILIRIGVIVGAFVLAWSVMARTSQAHGTRQVVTVRPYQTLWTIAAGHYGGDVRDAIWRIEQANHLSGADIRVGQTLVLP